MVERLRKWLMVVLNDVTKYVSRKGHFTPPFLVLILLIRVTFQAQRTKLQGEYCMAERLKKKKKKERDVYDCND